MEQRFVDYSKFDTGMIAWLEGSDYLREESSCAILSTVPDLHLSQVRFLRQHGVWIPERRQLSGRYTVRDIVDEQIYCLVSKPYVIGISLSRKLNQLHPIQ